MILKTVKSAIIILGIFIQCTFGSVISSKVTSQSDAIGILAQGKIQQTQVTNQIMDADNESSLYHTLTNLTNNTLINITTNTTLFSTVQLRNLENISIIGHNKPTVECANIGGMLLFISSYNYTVLGITLTLVILPVLLFLMIELVTHKGLLKFLLPIVNLTLIQTTVLIY